jgi:hypothetical protein
MENEATKVCDPAVPTGFLQEDNGNNSMMRLMSVVCLLAALAVSGIMVLKSDPGFNGLYIFTTYMIAAFAPKAVQKFAEQKMPVK